MTDEEAVLSRVPGTVGVDTEAGEVLLGADGELVQLDAIGSRVWQLLAGGPSYAVLVRTLCHEYAVDPETCRRDVDALLDRLRGHGLVTPG